MDLAGIIHGLHEEKKRLDKMIYRIELLQSQQTAETVRGTRQGKRGRKSMSVDERKVVAERMKKYWEARRSDGGDEPAS
jgi:hypothetical protein